MIRRLDVKTARNAERDERLDPGFAAIEQSAEARMRGVAANGPFIKRRRRSRGLTQEALATAAQCDIKTIYRAEVGARLDMATLKRLAESLHVPYRKVVKRIEDD